MFWKGASNRSYCPVIANSQNENGDNKPIQLLFPSFSTRKRLEISAFCLYTALQGFSVFWQNSAKSNCFHSLHFVLLFPLKQMKDFPAATVSKNDFWNYCKHFWSNFPRDVVELKEFKDLFWIENWLIWAQKESKAAFCTGIRYSLRVCKKVTLLWIAGRPKSTTKMVKMWTSLCKFLMIWSFSILFSLEFLHRERGLKISVFCSLLQP